MSRNLKLLIALIITATAAAYILFVTIPTQMASRSYSAAKALGEDLRQAFRFTPEIRVNNTIVVNQQTPVFELAVLSENFQHHYLWEHTWLGSTKRIAITGTFRAKAGFDLQRKFSIRLKDDRAVILLPRPEALSVESLGDIIYRDDQGMWNWVNAENRARATNAFIKDARRYADQAAFLKDARKEIESRLRALLKPYVDRVEFQYQQPLPRR